jgi:hypothetical protein
MFVEFCDFTLQVLSNDYPNPKEQAVQLLEFYNTQWRAFSASLQSLDSDFQPFNALVNRIYSSLEKDDDKDDYPFSILKMGMVIWRYRVYKRVQKQVLKASEVVVK